MAEIIGFGRGSQPALRERIAAAIRAASHDRVSALIAEEHYWQMLATAAWSMADFEEAKRLEARAEALFQEIVRTEVTTIEAAIAQLRFLSIDPVEWVALVAAGVEDIAAGARGWRSKLPPIR